LYGLPISTQLLPHSYNIQACRAENLPRRPVFFSNHAQQKVLNFDLGMAQHYCFFHCVRENPFASLGKRNIDGCGYFGFGDYAFFYFGTNVFVRF